MAKLWTRRDQEAFGRAVNRRIVARVKRSKTGIDDQPLKPLKDGSPSTLRRSGLMLRTTLAKTQDDKVSVISSEAPYAGFVDDQRPWLGLSPSDLKQVDRTFEAILDEVERRYDRSRGTK